MMRISTLGGHGGSVVLAEWRRPNGTAFETVRERIGHIFRVRPGEHKIVLTLGSDLPQLDRTFPTRRSAMVALEGALIRRLLGDRMVDRIERKGVA